MYKLYVYDHCPFCIKARNDFGLHTLPFDMVMLQNDDEATPKAMIGRKMLPILEENGQYMGESMDIVAHIEKRGAALLTGSTNPQITDWIQRSSSVLYRQFLPRAACAPFPEFSTTAGRAYFVRNKEQATGPFSEILSENATALAPLNAFLQELAPLIQSKEAVNGTLSTDDIHLFAHLHSLSIIKGLVYPSAVEDYRKTLSARVDIPLLDSIAV
ncbi:MAG: glutaredoxin 2 [Acetobacter orientalis]|uniref:glutaredoxin 2 n=1 Tax=Acetobacter orientalis TaxID=146474 RepID=UPI0039E84835